MAVSISASEHGLKIVDRARLNKGWTKTEEAWSGLALTSKTTLKRFWAKDSIRQDLFIAICQAVGIADWQAIANLALPLSFGTPTFPAYDPQTWVGREALISDLLSKLRGQTRLVWIKGMSGIGKTTLGECVASRAWESDRAFQWVYLEILEGDSLDFGSVAARLLTEMNDADLDPQLRNNPEQIAQRLIQRLKSSAYWIQLDSLERLLNPEQPTEFVDAYWAVFLQRCLTESDLGSRLVLTSQALPTVLEEFSDRYSNRWQEIILQGLSTDDQQAEHLELFGKNGVTVDEISSVQLKRIGKIYEGHPLVLQVMANEIRAKPFNGNVETYWQRYGKEFEQDARELQTEQVNPVLRNKLLQKRVRHRVETSLKRLPVDALDMLCRSSVYRRLVPEIFWLEMIKYRTPQEQQQAYGILRDRALVEQTVIHEEQFLIRQHNLIRAVAYDLLKIDTNAWETSERQAAHLWLTGYQPAAEDANLEKVRGYLEAFDHYCEVEDWEAAKDILLTPLDSFGKKHLLRQIFDWSLYQEGIIIGQKILKKSTLDADVVFLNMLGNDYVCLGNYPIAIDYYEQSLTIAREIGDRQGEGKSLGNLGLTYNYLGQYDRAIDFLQQQLTITREIGDRQGEGIAVGNLGNAYNSLGQYDRSIDFHQQSLIIKREIGDRHSEGGTLGNLGIAYYSLGQYDRAIDFHQQYLTIAREIGNRQGEGISLGNLGNAYNSLGQYDRAIDFHQQYLTIAREIGDRQGEGMALGNLGITQIKLKQYPESLTNNQTALEIFREIGDRANEAESLKNLAELHQALGEVEEARQYCQQALVLATELGIPLAAECEALLLKINF